MGQIYRRNFLFSLVALLLIGAIATLPLWGNAQNVTSISASEVIEKSDSDIEDFRTQFEWLGFCQAIEASLDAIPFHVRRAIAITRPTFDLKIVYNHYRRGPPA